jgi:predicted TIM-barrel fold metal-dependent hydrolase
MIDGLVLLGENRFRPALTVERALAVADEDGVEHLVAAPARPHDYHLEPANTALAEVRDRHADRVTLLGRIDPLNGARAVTEAVRVLDELGAAGIFVHPAEEWFPVSAARDVAAVAADRGVPLVVATGYFGVSEPLQVAELAEDFPSLTVIMTTGGQINISGLSMIDAWTALTRWSNLHVMTNGEYRQDFIERLATEFEVHRVLWGSFAPTFDQRFELRRIRSASMSDEARSSIEHRNAARIFNIQDSA